MAIVLLCVKFQPKQTSIFGEPNDFILEVKEADVKNGDDLS